MWIQYDKQKNKQEMYLKKITLEIIIKNASFNNLRRAIS